MVAVVAGEGVGERMFRFGRMWRVQDLLGRGERVVWMVIVEKSGAGIGVVLETYGVSYGQELVGRLLR